mgnify:CR=1 FL=1
MDADTNFFKVFGLPLCWQIDLKVLKEKHRSLQKDFHPDLFVNSSEVEKQRSVEKASVINEGFRVLSSPLSRANIFWSCTGVMQMMKMQFHQIRRF